MVNNSRRIYMLRIYLGILRVAEKMYFTDFNLAAIARDRYLAQASIIRLPVYRTPITSVYTDGKNIKIHDNVNDLHFESLELVKDGEY